MIIHVLITISSIQKLLNINRNTGIKTRSAIIDYSLEDAADSIPSSIEDMDHLFRTAGVDMAVKACKKAIEEWSGSPGDITHTVAVTCTNQGNPGFDVLVNEKLGLSTSVDRTLLHGVGCAGALTIMRTAAQLACGAMVRNRPARILCFACELCTPNIGYELDAVAKCTDTSQVGISSVLFSDAAAAFVLCNDLGLRKEDEPLFELLDWTTQLIPGTSKDLQFHAEAKGMWDINVVPTLNYIDFEGRISNCSRQIRLETCDSSCRADVQDITGLAQDRDKESELEYL